jgi:hypothetical protein
MHFKHFSFYSFNLLHFIYIYIVYSGPTIMGPTCHTLHLTYITSYYFIHFHSPPPFSLFHCQIHPHTSFSYLALKQGGELKISDRKGTKVGRPPPPLGHPPGHLLLYKNPFSHCFYAPSTLRIFSVQAVFSFEFPARA